MWITKLRVIKVFQRNLPILSFHVPSALSLHLPSVFFLLLCSFSPLPLKCFPLRFLQLRTPRLVSSFLSAEELYISNIILISIDNTLLVLFCFDLIHIFIELEVDVHLFSTNMAPFLLDKELQFTFSDLF